MPAVLEKTQRIEQPAARETVVTEQKIDPALQEKAYSVHSTLEQLPGHSVILGSKTTGEELGKILANQPELPGVILWEQGQLIGVISQSHYYKCVSRAFGREIYQGRSATLMLGELKHLPLVLSSDCGIQSAVEECLARPTELVYEPFAVHRKASNEYRICSFQSLLLASSQIAALRNDQMAQILDSITDGLLVIDRSFQIGNEYSRAAAQIFERTDLEQFTLLEILEPLVDSTLHGQIADYLKVLFNPKLIDKLIKTINPAKQITATFPLPEEHIRHLTFNFERVKSHGEISQVLVRIDDVTHQLNLSRELEKQEAAAEEKLQLILQILRVEPTVLTEFIRRFREGVADLVHLSEGDGGDLREKIHAVFRTVHTLKGESALLQLGLFERPLHKLEDGLASLRDNPELKASNLASISPAVDNLKMLDESVSDALAHLNQLSPQRAAATGATSTSVTPGPLTLATRLIADLSERLAKPVSFHSLVREEDLPEAYREVINELLLHLVRNSMVHGIESPSVREARGKSAIGTIQFALKPHPDFHEIIFQDDGAGLDYARIRQRAAQMGRTLSRPEELHEAIFSPGFSTAENVSDLAGRGVGLDAIRHSIMQRGGSIHVYSEEGSYCAFQVLLPRTVAKEAA
jgi:PAS domain-containing protein